MQIRENNQHEDAGGVLSEEYVIRKKVGVVSRDVFGGNAIWLQSA